LIVNPGCHLCEEAEPRVRRAAARFGLAVEIVQMESDDELVREYAWRIPVLLAADGRVLAEGIIEDRPLRRALKSLRG